MQSVSNIDRLCETLGLTPHQSEFLKSNIEKYDVHGIAKRGGVLYIPHRSRGFWNTVVRMVRGAVVDRVGCDGVVARCVRCSGHADLSDRKSH